MLRQPPDILITTPESLFLLLTSRARATLASVETVIVDEIHAVVGTKRGAHLALSLERLEDVARRPLQRIGLSATQRPLETVARFLGGGEGVRKWKPRPVVIVDAGAKKAFDLRVEVPVEDMSRPAAPAAAPTLGEDGTSAPPPPDSEERSIWPAMHPRLLELVRQHRSTILFVNARRLAERLATALNDLAGEELARAHHGSIAREERQLIEEALKAGTLRALVATSTSIGFRRPASTIVTGRGPLVVCPPRKRAISSSGRWVADRPIRCGGSCAISSRRSSESARCAPRLKPAIAWISSTITH